MYNSTLTRKTPLKAKTALKAKTSLRCYTTLRAKKSLRQCSIDKYKAGESNNVSPRAAGAKKKTQRPYKPKYPYESIFTTDLKRCFITGCTDGYVDGEYHRIHIHHIFGASTKANSEKYHFLIPLRDDYHEMTPYSIHKNRDFELTIKRFCQEYWLFCYGTKEDFIDTFGKWW